MITVPFADWRVLGPLILLIAVPIVVPGHTPELHHDSAWYTVAGSRHGISFFSRARHEGVEHEPDETLTFDRYHTAHVMYEWLQPRELRTVHFQLRTRGDVAPFDATVELLSTRGGRSERTIEIRG